MSSSLRDLLRARVTNGAFQLAAVDPDSMPGARKPDLPKLTAANTDAIAGLQERLWAEQKRSLLLILQGLDTAGKDGTIKRVVGAMNPLGVRIVGFKAPTSEELSHHFLWRIRKQLPDPGQVVVFNRSHYEDVVVVRVRELVEPDVWRGRYAEINEFEEQVAQAGTIVVKVFLHISYDEQRKRLLARLENPKKHWKFNPADLDDRLLWDSFQAAYSDAIARCSTEAAPWFVVPANDKRYRDFAVGRLLVETLEEADPRYPETHLDVEELKKRLQS